MVKFSFWFMGVTGPDGFPFCILGSSRHYAARGTANELAQLALVYAKDKHSKVEVFWSGGIPLRFETSRLQATRWN